MVKLKISRYQISTLNCSNRYLSSGLRLCQLKPGEHILTITHFHTLVPCVNTVAELGRSFPGSMLSLLSLTVSLTWASQQQQLACSSRVGRWFQTGGTGAILTWNSSQQNKTFLTFWHPHKNPIVSCNKQQGVCFCVSGPLTHS